MVVVNCSPGRLKDVVLYVLCDTDSPVEVDGPRMGHGAWRIAILAPGRASHLVSSDMCEQISDDYLTRPGLDRAMKTGGG